MFAYILRVRTEPDEQSAELFRRPKQEPGLLHAFQLQAEDDPLDGRVVTIWDSRESAVRYLETARLRQEVDGAYPQVTRVMYNVLDST
jgi:heme-degrading monooxygenase HmoA